MKDNEPDRIQDTAVQYGKLYRLEKENKDKRRICLIAERLSAIMWQILPPDCSVNKRLCGLIRPLRWTAIVSQKVEGKTDPRLFCSGSAKCNAGYLKTRGNGKGSKGTNAGDSLRPADMCTDVLGKQPVLSDLVPSRR